MKGLNTIKKIIPIKFYRGKSLKVLQEEGCIFLDTIYYIMYTYIIKI